MPSPFSGMDPWLEDPAVFPDFHDSLIFLLKKALNATLPAGYAAMIKTIVWTEDEQRREPDVSAVTRRPPSRSGRDTTVALADSLQPLGFVPERVPREEQYLEILSTDGRRLVTAVEVLSRSNKAGRSEGRKAYLKKQREFLAARVNVVEIDLLRGGVHTTAVPRSRLVGLAGGPFHYHVCVLKAGKTGRLFGAVLPLDRPLPAIGFPLDRGVEPVTVELQAVLTEAYDTGRYAELIDYTQPCTPPLSPEEQAWADGILRARTATNLHEEK
jgi:hypothetical protein